MATHKTFSNIYLAADYADVEIRCGTHVFHAHRAAVCARSKVLDLECKTAFSAGGKVVVEHSTFEAPILDCVLQFVYQNEYGVPAAVDDSKGADASLVTHVHVHAFADMYDIADLKSLAAQNFVTAADAATDLSTAQIIELVASIYTQTTGSEDVLRAKILEMAFATKEKLAQDADFVKALITRPDIHEFATSYIGGIPAEYQKILAAQRTKHRGVVEQVNSAREQTEKNYDSLCTLAKRIKDTAAGVKDELEESKAEQSRLAEELSKMKLEAQLVADTEAWRASRIVECDAEVAEAKKELAAARASLAQHRKAYWEKIVACRHCSTFPFRYFESKEGRSWVAQCNSCRTRHYYPVFD